MLNTILTTPITQISFSICLGTALILGILSSQLFTYRNASSSSFSFALVILPVTMCMVIMMINGNLGLAVSVAGSFTLVRFRSVAGTGREISAIFVVMAIGLMTGMGYIGAAVLFFVVIALTVLAMTLTDFGSSSNRKLLRVTIPDRYDYDHLLDDVFAKHGVKAKLERVKTTNLGSLIEVSFILELTRGELSKEFLDDLRCKNANLEVQISNFSLESERL